MTREQLSTLRKLAEAATQVSQKWHLDHDDTFIAAQKVPEEHDWYWITGNMETKDNGYNGACSDEDFRGPKEVVQTHCRYISAANPAAILELLDCLEKAVEVITSIYTQRMSCYLSTDDMLRDHFKKCGEFLASMEGGDRE